MTDDVLALMEAEETPAPRTEMVDRVRDEARRARDLIMELADLEARTEEKKRALTTLKTKTLPDLLNAAQLRGMALEPEGNTPGYDVALKPWYNAAISKDDPAPAHDWLEAQGYGDIIKHTFTVTFGRDEHEDAAALRTLLNNHGFEYEEKRGVHPSTLQAWVREQIEDYGTALPKELLNLEVGQTVKIEVHKEKTTKKRGKHL